MELVRVKDVKPLHDFVVHVWFSNDTDREIDLDKYLRGPVFEEIRSNSEVFRSIKVDERMKTICWENGVDIDPDTLYHDLKPAWAEEIELELAK
jgi:anaerobic glycerol-3-phosphate dehydrogenase